MGLMGWVIVIVSLGVVIGIIQIVIPSQKKEGMEEKLREYTRISGFEPTKKVMVKMEKRGWRIKYISDSDPEPKSVILLDGGSKNEALSNPNSVGSGSDLQRLRYKKPANTTLHC